MGSCVSNICNPMDNQINSQINRYILENQEKESHIIRILLLGSGDSGKTTFIKQLKKIHKCIPNEVRKQYIQPIYEALVDYMKLLCEKSLIIGENDEQAKMSNESKEYAKILLAYEPDPETAYCSIPKDLREKMIKLWEDPAIKYTFTFRSQFYMEDSADHLLNRMNIIASDNYEVTDEDYILLHTRTTGFVEETFHIKIGPMLEPYEFIFTDVGGQRAERKKWLTNMQHDNMKCVLYVCAIGDYDMVCFEDSNANRVQESLGLFSAVLEYGFMDSTSVVLLFNKNDLFIEKIKRVPITVAFPDFSDHQHVHDDKRVVEFIYSKFFSLYKKYKQNRNKEGNGQRRDVLKLHMHRTCALDTNQTEKLMADLQMDIVKQQLYNTGMLR